jgi:hypothetical protein
VVIRPECDEESQPEAQLAHTVVIQAAVSRGRCNRDVSAGGGDSSSVRASAWVRTPRAPGLGRRMIGKGRNRRRP